MTDRTDLAVLALGDQIAASADDLGVRITTRDARRLAPHVLELLALAGWELVRARRSQRQCTR